MSTAKDAAVLIGVLAEIFFKMRDYANQQGFDITPEDLADYIDEMEEKAEANNETLGIGE